MPCTVTEDLRTSADVAGGDYGQLLAEFRSGQELLREAEVRFKLLVETIPGVAYIAEPGEHGAWLYISPRLQQLLGYAPEEWIAEPTSWIDLIHPDDRTQVLEDEAGWTETTGGVHVGEYRLRASDGTYRWIRDAATAQPGDEAGCGEGAVVRCPVRHHRVPGRAGGVAQQRAAAAFGSGDGAGRAPHGRRTGAASWSGTVERRRCSADGGRREDGGRVLGHQLGDPIVPKCVCVGLEPLLR